MHVLITGSWRQHSTLVFNEVMCSAELIGIEPTSIVTGGWVGVDMMARDYAKSHGIPHKQEDLTTKPNGNFDAVILISCNGEFDLSDAWMNSLKKSGLPILIW